MGPRLKPPRIFAGTAWLLLLLLAGWVPDARGNSFFGFSLAPGENLTQVLDPSSTLALAVFWDSGDTRLITGLLDGNAISHGSVSTHGPTGQKTTTFSIVGSTLTVGRHTLDLTCTASPPGAEIDTLNVILFNEYPVQGLTVSNVVDGNIWGEVGTTFSLNAQVTGGSQLQSEWLIGTVDLILQTYADGDTALSYVKVWDNPVVHPITLIVSNDNNAMGQSFTMNIVHPINGISINKTSVSSEANTPVSLKIQFASDMKAELGEVSYEVTWGDSASDQALLNITPGNSFDLQHRYTSQGNMDIVVKIISKIDQEEFTIPAAIWDNLSNVSITVSPRFGKPGDVFTVSIINPPSEGFQYSFECGDGTVVSNEASVLSQDYSPPSPALSCSYSLPDVYEIKLKAFNDVYQTEATETVVIETVLSEDMFALDPVRTVIPVPDGIITVTASIVDPGAMGAGLCSWNFDAVNGTMEEVGMNIPTDFPDEQTFTYTAPGTYNVSFHCKNNISQIYRFASILVRDWEMTNLRVVVKNPIVMNDIIPTEDSLINMTLLDVVRPPTGLEANFTYGDESPPAQFIMTQWDTYHRYPRRGVYDGFVFLSHAEKGNISVAFKVRQGAFQVIVNPLGGLVEQQVFVFTVEVPGPFSGSLQVNFGDGENWDGTVTTSVTKNYTAQHTYMVVEDYSASLIGRSTSSTNPYSETVSFEGVIEINGPVENIHVTIFPESVLYPPGDITATISLERDKHKIKDMVCWIDFKEKLDPGLRSWNGTLRPRQSFKIDFSYLTLGAKTVSVNCSNDFSDQTVLAYATTFNPCFSDDPIFDRQYGVYDTPMIVLNSVELRLVTRTVVFCLMSIPNFRWWLYDYTLEGGYIGERTDLVQPHVDYLVFPPGSLEPGLYKMTLNISFGPEEDYIWLQESTFVRIVQVPLVAEIFGGALRLTGEANALVDGYTMSYDPVYGVDNKTGLLFIWECKTYDTTTIGELTAAAPGPTPVDLSSNCDDVSTEVTPGKRRLQVPSDVTAKGYLFKLRVTKGNSTSAPSTLYLQYSATSINIELRCVVNCGGKVAVSSPMALTTVCVTCSEGLMLDSTYSWSLTIWNNDTRQFENVPDPASYFVESGRDNGQAVTVAANRLHICSRYRIQGYMVLPNDQDAAATREFITNCPPWGGQCDVEPRKGDVLKQKFTLSCTGWLDDGYDDPTNLTQTDDGDYMEEIKMAAYSLYYKFMLRKNDIIVPIAEGGESNMPRIELPLIPNQEGEEYDLVARIYDVLQDYTEVSMAILLNSSSSDNKTELENTVMFWNGQATYTERSSTLNKQLRGMTTASALFSTYPLSDARSTLEQAADGENGSVVTQDWSSLWNDLNNPIATPVKDQMTMLTQRFSKLVYDRKNETEALTGQGLTALGEGMATILFRPEFTDEAAAMSGADVAQRGGVALKKLFTTVPFPVGSKVDEAVFSMAGLIDKVIAASVPSYDLSIGAGLVFNATDVGEDDSNFMISRIKWADVVSDRRHIETTRQTFPSVENALDMMLDSLLSQQVLGQPNKAIERDSLALVTNKLTGRSLVDTTVSTSTVDLDMVPNSQDADAALDVKATVFNKNPYAWAADGSSYEITSPVVKLDLKDKSGSKNLQKLTMRLKRGKNTPVPEMETYSSADTRRGPDGWIYNRLTLRSGSSAVVTQFKCPTGVTKAVAYFRTGRPPTRERYDVRTEGEVIHSRRKRASRTDPTLTKIVESSTVGTSTVTARYKTNRATTPDLDTITPDLDTTEESTSDITTLVAYAVDGPTYKFFASPGSLSAGIVFVGFELPELVNDNNETFEYQFMSFSDACRVWNDATQTWETDSCTVSAFSTPQETVCICDNPPGMSFASSFFVAPNTIDFDTVFSKFDLSNASVYGTLIGLVVVWVLALLWARRKDRQDKERWLVGYLKDNLVDDSYFYLLTVHTGIRRGAGTLSNVKFILTGADGDTGVRVLSDGKRSLDTGSIMTYIMATTQGLGDLSHVRVWHDDSGPFGKASWFLGRVVAEDLQTGERYNFICEKWLALDKDDGLIDRIIPVTLKDEIMTFDKLFSEHTRVGITDTHLWISCFMRPERSTFTRMQRISCCMALLLLTMITSALFYQPEDNETGESTNKVGMEVTIGIMRFSMTTLWTSTVSIIITTIPILIFVALFRSSRPKPGPRTRASKHRTMGLIQMTKSSKTLKEKSAEGEEPKQNLSDLLDNTLQQNPLPHFCVYLTWLLLLGTIATCAFFLILYSMQWGSTTSEEWLASFFVSFFESIFVLDPVKVLLLACLLAYCASNPYFNTQHQHVDLGRVYTEAETFGRDEIDPTAIPPDPVPENVLEAARKRREQEQLAQSVFYELVLYSFFVFCVFAVSYGNRDQNTYLVNEHLNNLLYSSDGDAPMPFESISSREDVMKYMKETIVQTTFPWTDMVGNELDWRQRLFSSDFTSFRVGPVRVRQVRMPPRDRPLTVARMYPSLRVNSKTYPPYNMEHQETSSFCLGWEPRSCTDEELVRNLTFKAWSYQSDITEVPIWGIFAFYPTGGYIADFAVNRDVVNKMVEELDVSEWLDLQTKAVFVELALYNPNVNLFSFIRMCVEFPEVGSNVVWKDFKTLRIFNYLGAKGAFILICELIAVVVVIIFSVKAIIKLKKQKRAYFKDFWQVLDLLTLTASYTALVFYIVKLLAVKDAMKEWRTNPKVYVDFYLTVLWDDMYAYILAGLVFITSVRLLRVLGYNQRITMIATVLARSSQDLLGFSVIFFVIITAYMAAGVILFVATMYEFRSIWDSYCTLYLVLLGKNVLGRFIKEAPMWAQAYFFSLTILVILILYTMFQAILCNTTSVVRSDIHTVPPPYGLTNVLKGFYQAVIADWIPHWFISGANKAVAPESGKAPAAGLRPAYLARLPPPHLQDDTRTQPHRVLAALSEHFNKLYQAEDKKLKRRKKKKDFTNLNQQKGMGSCDTLI